MLDPQVPPPAPGATPAPPILKYFEYAHLPGYLQAVSKPFHDLAHALVATTQPGREQTKGLDKLLEAKDLLRPRRARPMSLLSLLRLPRDNPRPTIDICVLALLGALTVFALR